MESTLLLYRRLVSRVSLVTIILLGLCSSISINAQNAFDSASFNAAKSRVEIIRITPTGKDVKTSSRQIVFKFNQPMVAVGQMQARADDIPVTIEPEVACQWRWLDTSLLSCQLNRDDELNKATEYHVAVHPGLKAVGGAIMKAKKSHSFVTQRPSINRIVLEDWTNAAKPVVRVSFNQPVTKASLLASLKFIGVDARYASDVMTPLQWNPLSDGAYLKYQGDLEYKFYPRVRNAENSEELSAQNNAELARRATAVAQARTVWRVSVEDGLPENSKINVGLLGGLKGIEGQVPGQKNAHVHQFTSLPKFEFKGVQCESASRSESVLLNPIHGVDNVLRQPETGEELSEACDPLRQVKLVFTTPISFKSAGDFIHFKPDLAGGDKNYDPWSTRNGDYYLKSFLRGRFNYASNRLFTLTVPEVLKAYEQYAVTARSGLRDELGRELKKPLDMAFLTAHRRPALTLSHDHSVLESAVDSELPVYVTNLEELNVGNYTLTTATQVRGPYSFSKRLSEVQDIAYRVPVGVRDLLNGESGLVVGELSSTPLAMRYGSEQKHDFVSQVTPFQVHLKLGHFKSLAWVTDLATGQPVEGAQVSLELDHISRVQPQRATESPSISDKYGLVELPGLGEIDPKLTHVYAYKPSVKKWLVKVRKGRDVAFLPVMNTYRASAQLWPYLKAKGGYMHTWGTTAQGVYKAGDTVQYKLYVRGQNNRHWIAAPKGEYHLSVLDPKGQVVQELKDLRLNAFGAFDGEFKTPKTAAVGWYDFKLKFVNEGSQYTLIPMRVLVSDFTPSPFKAGNDLNSDRFELGDTVKVSSYAKMHAGGPYANAQARVTANLAPKQFTSDHPLASGFRFSSSGGSRQTLHQSQGELNKHGEWSAEFDIKATKALYGAIQVETAVRDDRGKYVASRSSAEFLGVDRFLGLKQNSWVQDVGKVAEVDYLVVDADGKPESGVQVDVLVEYQVTRAARVKGAGNAYLTQYSQSWEELSRCSGVSVKAVQSCKFTPTQAGYHRVSATIKSRQGRDVKNSLYTWAVGDGAVIWDQGNTNHIDIVPDKASYSSGDTAKFLIKNPYPGAHALITVERYGVLRSWQQRLQGSTPIIKVPIEQDDYPGVYLSVVVTSPRVDKPLGDGDVDLAKPAFKMGYTKVNVRDGDKQINVKVRSDKKVYKPRDTVKISVKAKPETGKRKPMELAVVVLDEAVFDLNIAGKGYYDPYKGFNRLDELGVANYNLLMRLIGRQRFDKKGANPGGGGGDGGADLRNLLKFVAYWNPSIELNKSGKAQFEFDLPDNLTGWRVLAMVVDKEERMGLGDHNFKVNRPTELRPVMPNQLTMGDTVDAGFSVMNRTNKPRELELELRASGTALKQPLLKTMRVALEPFERKRVWLPLTADNIGELAFYAKAGDAKDSDALEHHLQVLPRYTIQSQATYGTSSQAELSEPVQFPDGIVPNVGGLVVEMSPSVIGNISGAFRYMRSYPYACWEQRLSKGVAAAQYQRLKPYLAEDIEWQASVALTQQMLDNAAQFQAANGGMAYWVNRDSYVSPYLSAYTAMAFVWLRDQGFDVPAQVEKKLHDYLKAYLRHSDARQVFNAQLSIRAVALAALAASDAIDIDELARYETHLPSMTLFGKAHYLNAAVALEWGDQKLSKIANDILSHSVQSAGKFSFQEQAAVSAPGLLSSSMRSNCSVLSALLSAANSSKAASELLGDVPFKLVRSITQTRGDRDHWANTQENVFCMNALIEFSRDYEKEAPNMSLAATFASESLVATRIGNTSFSDLRDQPVALSGTQIPVQPKLTGRVKIDKQGTGRYYYSVRTDFAMTDDNAKPVNAGIEVRREYSVQRGGQWQALVTPMLLEKGELVRVDLFVSTSGPRNYVVVDDPVPGGLEPVNRDLATASTIDAGHAKFVSFKESWYYQYDNWRNFGRYGYSFYHQELRHDSARFYSDYLPAGNYHLSYTAQAIASGRFAVKPLKVEEMYEPDVFGLGLPARLNVESNDD